MGHGPQAPFVLAIPALMLCFALISLKWNENYGNVEKSTTNNCLQGLRQIFMDPKVMMLGCLQTVIESCMYIFVFLWTPVMGPAEPPLGMVFACFMVAIMIGSSIYSIAISHGFTSGQTLQQSLIMIAVSMGVCTLLTGTQSSYLDIELVYFAFILFEVAIGIYFPSMSYLKSQFIPEACRANIMNWFRVPMNVITCIALLCLRNKTISGNKSFVFLACFTMSLVGLGVVRLFNQTAQTNASRKTDEKEELI